MYWAMGAELERCQTESLQARTGHEIITASLAAQLQDVTERHYYADQSIKQWAAKLAKEEQAKKDAYAELGKVYGARVVMPELAPMKNREVALAPIKETLTRFGVAVMARVRP